LYREGHATIKKASEEKEEQGNAKEGISVSALSVPTCVTHTQETEGEKSNKRKEGGRGSVWRAKPRKYMRKNRTC